MVEKNKSGTGNLAQLVGCLPSLKNALVSYPVLHKLALVLLTCDPSIGVVEARGSEAQGHFGVHSRFEASLNYSRMHLLKRETKEERK